MRLHIKRTNLPTHPPAPPPRLCAYVCVCSNSLDFSWRLKAGLCESRHYGLLLARAVGFPAGVLEEAERVVAGEALARGLRYARAV